MAREIRIDLSNVDTNAHRMSNTYIGLITRTVLCLPIDVPRRVDDENISRRFQPKNLFIWRDSNLLSSGPKPNDRSGTNYGLLFVMQYSEGLIRAIRPKYSWGLT